MSHEERDERQKKNNPARHLVGSAFLIGKFKDKKRAIEASKSWARLAGARAQKAPEGRETPARGCRVLGADGMQMKRPRLSARNWMVIVFDSSYAKVAYTRIYIYIFKVGRPYFGLSSVYPWRARPRERCYHLRLPTRANTYTLHAFRSGKNNRVEYIYYPGRTFFSVEWARNISTY